MDHSTPTTETIVKSANQAEYAIPEVQRDFVWSPSQVMDFAESLARNFPVGSILTWKSDIAIQRGDSDQRQRKSWLIDGQQRTIALCTLFGKQPEWWDHSRSGTWTEHLRKYNIHLDIGDEALKFVTRNTPNGKRYVSVRDILSSDNLYALAEKLVAGGRAFSDEVGTVAKRLQQVADLKKAVLPVVEIDDDIGLTDVAEIFKRLNSAGTGVQKADIYLGVVASKNPGWVNTNFLVFQDQMSETGFDIEPAFLFRAFTAIGAGRIRFNDVPAEFWDDLDQGAAWDKTKKALQSACQGLREYGIANDNLVLSLNALVAVAICRNKFPQGSFGPFLAWMISANRSGFFSRTTDTRLSSLISALSQSENRNKAMRDLYKLIEVSPDGNGKFGAEEFLEARSSRSSIQRLMVYLIAFRNNAQDWGTEGYHIRAVASGPYRPEWHHIFPRKWLRDNIPELPMEHIDTVANMAVISGDANRKIAASEPKQYVTELNLAGRGLLDQQAIPDPTFVAPDQYLDWLQSRAERLAQESNKYLDELSRQT